MYQNLRAEMARSGISQKELSKALSRKGLAVSSLCCKMCGKYEFRLSEAVAIKQALGTDVPLEVLFEK